MRCLSLPTACAAVFCTLSPARAAVVHVPKEHATIQAGVLAASAGDTVLVAPGAYAELIRMKNGVVLRSSAGPDSTRLESPGGAASPLEDRLFECMEGIDRSTVIEGFLMQAGMVRGAAIYCNQASPTIRGNVLRTWGWGIDLRDSSNAIIEDNLIEDCRAFGIHVFASSPIIRRNTLANNDPRAISVGGRKSRPVIGGSKKDANRIYGSRYAIVNESRNDIDATWNDWGWAASTEMERYPYPTDVSVIQDGNDRGKTHRGRGKVDYRHWLLPTKAEAAAQPGASQPGAQPSAANPTQALADTTMSAAPTDGVTPSDAPGSVTETGAESESPNRLPWILAAATTLAVVIVFGTRSRRRTIDGA